MWSSTAGWSLVTFGGGCVVSGIATDLKVGQWLIWGGTAFILIGIIILILPASRRLFGSNAERRPNPYVYGRAGDGGAVAIAGPGGTVAQNFIVHPASTPSPKADREIVPDMTLMECVTSLLGTPNWYSGIPGQADRLLDLLQNLSQEAALSHLTIWGRRNIGSGLSMVGIKSNLEPIAPQYWSTHVIDEIQFLENREGRSRGILYETHDAFIDLHVCKQQIETRYATQRSIT
jgi:hypothetical protein